jgi:hypothetical protein
VPHGVSLDGSQLFFSHVHLHGGPAPVRRYLPQLIDLVFAEEVNPGRVFDLVLPIDGVAEGYRAMDERRAIKALLRPSDLASSIEHDALDRDPARAVLLKHEQILARRAVLFAVLDPRHRPVETRDGRTAPSIDGVP